MGHKALTILDEKAAKEDLSAMFRLLSGVLKHQSTADAKTTAAAYLLSLNSVSHWALKTATRDIMKGKAEGLSKHSCLLLQSFTLIAISLREIFEAVLSMFSKPWKNLKRFLEIILQFSKILGSADRFWIG
ncbi:hypothetical protein [Bartonella bacilliformis]|uniref:hypothetical protein n=1 Tax=Bartonella bacilliformis TaxID=774 RepID=UPI001FD8E3B3|nr:hypothetical protein [Bartonella bacilliformis]